MSDDTKALVERLRTIGIDALDSSRAADAIERLEGAVAYWRDATEHTLDRATESLRESRDALAERCEKLREALLDVAVEWHTASALRCRVCEQTWVPGSPERHAPGCLAAPKDAP